MVTESVEDRLVSLANIYDRGVLTKQEYDDLRKNILLAAYGPTLKAADHRKALSRLERRFVVLVVAVVTLTLTLSFLLGNTFFTAAPTPKLHQVGFALLTYPAPIVVLSYLVDSKPSHRLPCLDKTSTLDRPSNIVVGYFQVGENYIQSTTTVASVGRTALLNGGGQTPR
eukprot:218830-Prorocentrum_minimum.AAC.2